MTPVRTTLVLALVLSGGIASAADPVAGRADDLRRQLLEQEQATERRVVGLGRIRLSHPQQLSGAVGAIVSRQPRDYDCTTICDFRGWVFQVEPGLGGGQIAAGWAMLIGEKRHSRHFMSEVVLGYGFKGTLLRTWGDANLNPADRTLVGIEGDFTVIQVNFSLSVLRRLDTGPGDDWMVAGGIGWGF